MILCTVIFSYYRRSLVKRHGELYISETRKDLKLTLEQERMLQAIIGAFTITSRTAA